MTIQEAIKSGKPFRRPFYDYWIVTFQGFFYVHQEEPTAVSVIFSKESILADDWEIKED